MALADKKYTELYASSKKTNIESVHSEGLLSHMIDNPEDDPHLTSVLKEIKDLQDELDALRTEISNNKDKTGITTSQANAITANTAKTTFPGLGTSSTTALAGDTKLVGIGAKTTLSFGDMVATTVKGTTTYTIALSVTTDFGGKTGSVTKSITLTLT